MGSCKRDTYTAGPRAGAVSLVKYPDGHVQEKIAAPIGASTLLTADLLTILHSRVVCTVAVASTNSTVCTCTRTQLQSIHFVRACATKATRSFRWPGVTLVWRHDSDAAVRGLLIAGCSGGICVGGLHLGANPVSAVSARRHLTPPSSSLKLHSRDLLYDTSVTHAFSHRADSTHQKSIFRQAQLHRHRSSS